MANQTVLIDSLDAAKAAVAQISPLVREYAQKAEDTRDLPIEVADAIGAAGLWAATAPREVGGSGLGRLQEQFEIIRSLAYEDSSAGWTLMILGGSVMLLGSRLPKAGRDEVYRDGVVPMAGSFMPGGTSTPVDGGVQVSGKWQFGSGINHARWVMANTMACDESGVPLPGDVFPVQIRAVVVPRDDVTVIDDWHVAGMRGTGSMSFAMDSVVVPDRRTFPFFENTPETDDLKYRLPPFALLAPSFAAMTIGVAQRMVDEAIALLPTRTRPPAFKPASENPTTQVTVGRAIAAVRAATLSTRSLFARYDARVDSGEDLANMPMAERAEIHHHTTWVAETCTATANELFRLGGASALYEPGPLQRCWRDLNTMSQHAYLNPTMHEVGAQVAFGLPVETPLV